MKKQFSKQLKSQIEDSSRQGAEYLSKISRILVRLERYLMTNNPSALTTLAKCYYNWFDSL